MNNNRLCDLVTNPKLAVTIFINDILGRVKKLPNKINDLKFNQYQFANLVNLIDCGKISNKIGKIVLDEMFTSGKDPDEIIKEKNLILISDKSEIEKIVNDVIDNNQKQWNEFKLGNDKLKGFFIGQIMKKSNGKVDPKMVNEILNNK